MLNLDSVPPADDTVDGVAVRRDHPLVEVVLSRPEAKNSLDLAAWHRLAAVFDELAKVEDDIVILLRGARGNLSAGSDISQFPKNRTGIVSAKVYNAAIDAALTAVAEVPHPVIAVVTGMAVGGGLELACAADIRIAASDARFGVPIARLGVSIGAVEARILLRVLTPARLKALLLTAQLLSAEEARRIGLVDDIVDPARLSIAARDLAMTVANGAPMAARANKLTVNAVGDGRIAENADAIDRLTAAIYNGQDLQEGIRAFLEKRPPEFGSSPARGRG